MSLTRKLANRKLFWALMPLSSCLFEATCTTEQLQAILTGVDVVADELLTQEDEDDISFEDWLASELTD